MKLLTLTAIAGLCLATSGPDAPPAPSRFALVELFTSEGCSSCPPADDLLARLSADAARSGEQIAALSFHVTYWNRLGWMDRFSDQVFTDRQDAYAERFSLQSLYTPQMVVDGEQQFVGSNAAAVEREVHAALARSRSARITVEARPDRQGVAATCHVAGAPEGSVLWVAWADSSDASSPDKGENQGRRLRHANVVRALERRPIRGGAYAGAIHLRRPESVPGSVVAWLQLGDVGPVLGGVVTPVGAEPAGTSR